MTTNNTSEETRMYNEQTSEETQRLENADEATRMADNAEDESTRLNPAAPVSRKAMAASPWASRLGFGIGGAALGFGAGFAVSANAGTADESVTGLAPAATPEEEMTPDEKADTVISDRERTVIDDPNELPNSTVNEVKTTDESLDVHVVETEEATTGTTASATAATTTVETPAVESATAASTTASPAVESATAASTTASPTVESATAASTTASPAVESATAASTTAATEEPIEVTIDDSAAEATAAQDTVEVTIDDTAAGTIPDQSDIILTNEHGVRYAHVDDNMSFEEAFAAAREQVGAPGVFEWHGNTYGTYYAEEWNEMSVEDRGEFIQNVDFPEDLDRDVDVVVPEPEPVPEPEVELEVLEVATTMDADGNVINAAHLTIDGVDTYMVDGDGDQIMDVAVVDTDGDGLYTEGVDIVIPIEEENITMNDVVTEMNPNLAITEDPAMDPAATEAPVVDEDVAMNDFDPNSCPDF